MTNSPVDKSDVLRRLRDLLHQSINDQNVKIYLFGSWARGTNKKSSDIDVGIWHPSSPGPEFFAHLRDLLEESTIPYRVDLVDLVHADPALRDKVQKEGLLWND